MVQVYLPMGYPIQTGAEFESIIYQGNLVRFYVLPKDPRSDSQLFERRFLSDVSKMRGTLGLWGKGAVRAALGPRWPSVLYQIIKGDINSWWSGAVSEWDGFTEMNQEDWRVAALYQATYNDVGKVFYCLSKVLLRSIDHYTGLLYKGSLTWGETDSAAALAWWVRDLTEVMPRGNWGLGYSWISTQGTWNDVTGGKDTTEAGASFTVHVKTSKLEWFPAALKSVGLGRLYMDGQDLGIIGSTVTSEDVLIYDSSIAYSGFHEVTVVNESGSLSVGYLKSK